MLEDCAYDLLPKILKGNPTTTTILRNKLHYDYNIDLKTYKVRSILRKLEKNGRVIQQLGALRNVLEWKVAV